MADPAAASKLDFMDKCHNKEAFWSLSLALGSRIFPAEVAFLRLINLFSAQSLADLTEAAANKIILPVSSL